MLKGNQSDLDFLQLLAPHEQQTPSLNLQEVKCSLFGDCSTQHLASILSNLFYKNGYKSTIYEGSFATYEAEIYDRSSAFYDFKSNLVVILNTTQYLRTKYYGYSDTKTALEEEIFNSTVNLWKTISEKGDSIILQSTYVSPYETFFGNYDTKVTTSLSSIVLSLNARLIDAARSFSNVFINDINRIASYVGRKTWFDEKMWIMSKSICAFEFLPYLAQNIIDIYLSTKGHVVKCIILDCDNTLWGGVIAEDGIEGISCGHYGEGEAFFEFQSYLLELKKRGILLAVCSQNNLKNVLLPFREHPGMVLKESDFAIVVANFNNKADNVKRIQETLKIGFDSMVFIDDNPFERNLIRKYLSDVIVPEMSEDPADFRKILSELNLFEITSNTEADIKRTELYQNEAKREQEKQCYTDVNEYLKSLKMKLEFTHFNSKNLERITQLINRSNQFNLTTKRYQISDCKNFMNDKNQFLPLFATLKDKYGDHGIISVVILVLDKPLITIDTWLMSCRVLARGVEKHIMNHVFEYARTHAYHQIIGKFLPTQKNELVKDFYKDFGFSKDGENWTVKAKEYVPIKTWIESNSLGMQA